MENIQIFRADLFCKIYMCYFHVPHIGVHNYSKLILLFDLLYTPIAHEVLPVSLVDSATAKVGDAKIYLTIHLINIILYFFYILFECGYILLNHFLCTSHTQLRSRWRSKSGDQKS